MIVNRGAEVHERIDVRDRDPDADGASLAPLRYRQLIQIEGIVVIDGGPEQLSQVTDFTRRRLSGGTLESTRLARGGGGKFRQQSALEHCGPRETPKYLPSAR